MAIAILLFRKKMLSVFEHVNQIAFPDASLCEKGEEKSIVRFVEVIKESLQYELHGRNWYLHGTAEVVGTQHPLCLAPHQDISWQMIVKSVEELTHHYSWCLLPWGVNYSGQMIAFASADDATFSKGLKLLQGPYYRDLHISTYTAQDLSEKRFRGAVFRCSSAEARAKALWKHGRGSCSSVFVLHYSSESSTPVLPARAEIVLEANGQQFGNPTRRRWVRIPDEQTLIPYLACRDRVFVSASDVDQRVMWLALQDYADIAESINQDPLYFGLKAFESASWIYVPLNDDDRWEIYINHEPLVTRSLFDNEELTGAPDFVLNYFC